TINPNDSVIWTWVSDTHDVLSIDLLFYSGGIYDTGHVYTNKFTYSGTFPYYCSYHGFNGTIIVNAGSNSPTVSITSPTNGATFTAPASVPTTADASDSDGNVTSVAFFDGTTFLGATNNPPYTVTATLATGVHPLTAVATDNDGLSATSAVVNVSVSVGN